VDTGIARKRLEEMRGELEKSITVLQGEQPTERAGSDSPQDPADVGTTLSETDRMQAILAAARLQRTAVLDALLRIEHGTYGTCADCMSPIPEGRLDARPEASRCVKCQAKRDRVRY
jgi:DnaK suppressor protein